MRASSYRVMIVARVDIAKILSLNGQICMSMSLLRKYLLFLLCSVVTLALVVQMPNAGAAKNDISFTVSQSGITATFNVEGSLGDTSVAPGDTTTVQASVLKKTFSITMDLTDWNLGTHTYGPYDTPMGTVSIPVTAGVNLDITGQIEGSIASSGNGDASPRDLVWSTWGSQNIVVNASQAKDGDTIGLTLSLSYVVNIGVSLPFLGRVIDVDLPGVQGSVPVVANVGVSTASSFPWLYVVIVVVILAAAIVLVIIFHRRRRVSKKTPAAPSPPAPLLPTPSSMSYCRFCGHPNRTGSKFCGKCGKRLS